MTGRPYVVLSCAISVDGRLDGTGGTRLVLSGAADLDRVDAERAASDAILVGAGTIRRDDPRLLIRSAGRRAVRAVQGQPEHPAGVTITASGALDPAAHFFDPGRGSARQPPPAQSVPARGGVAGGGVAGGGVARRWVYCVSPAAAGTRERLGGLAVVIDAGDPVRLETVLADLAGRGVRRLMVEGGAQLGAEFLGRDLVDELQLVVAPFFVGDPAAPRFAGPGQYPHGPGRPMELAEVRAVGQVVLLRYLLARAGAADPGQLPAEASLGAARGTGNG